MRRPLALRSFLTTALAGAVLCAGLTAAWLAATIPVEPVTINVRWGAATTDDARVALERRLGLMAGDRREGTTWAYVLEDSSPAGIRAIVEEPAVEDTANVDRLRFTPLEDTRSPRILGASLLALLVGLLAGAGVALLLQLHPVALPGQALAVIAGAAPGAFVVAGGGLFVASLAGYVPWWRVGPAPTLVEAAARADRAMADRLLRGGADPRARAPLEVDGRTMPVTPLEAAVWSGDWMMVRTVLDHGAGIDGTNRRSLACLAVRRHATGVLQFIPELGGPPRDCEEVSALLTPAP